MDLKLHKGLLVIFMFSFFLMNAQQKVWEKKDLNISKLGKTSNTLDTEKFTTYKLDFNNFKNQFTNVNRRGTNSRATKIAFPNLKGEFTIYDVYEAPIMSDEVAALYPNIKTYVGFSADGKGTRIRFTVSPQGVQTMTSYTDKPTEFIVPLVKGNNTEYINYSKNVRENIKDDFYCSTEELVKGERSNSISSSRDADDQILRTFRIAITTNGEYTNFWGDDDDTNGTNQEDALAQVVTTLNRNNEVFEVDMAVTFTLVNGVQYTNPTTGITQDLIFDNPSTDPFTGSFNSETQNTLTARVGEANYDIGHLFAFAGKGGSAGCIGCVCVDNEKGSGYSAHDFTDNDGGTFMADFFDIDYVPHEIGHQMGALHTHTQADNNDVNFEPGSGTTIMGYAGITGPDDVQDHSDPYFHYASINQILNNLETRTCWTSTAITNAPPVAEAGDNYTIPQGTAFVLRGSATDADSGDVLTYTWEQIDDGLTDASTFGPTLTSGPVWRSRPPNTSPNRYMPFLARVVAGELTETNPTETADNSSWETVSTVSRELNFALTVRDRSEANGTGQTPQTSFDIMKVTVDASAGPFVVTSQTANETWNVGTTQTITWDVAGTNGGNVNTPNVNIKLSTDGGVTFPFVLATNVPNNGSHNISVPVTGGDSTQARVMVEGNNNIFFAINSSDFSIQESEFALSVDNPTLDVCKPNDAVYTFTYNTFNGFTGTTNFTANNLPTGASIVFNPTSASTDDTSVTATISGIGSVALGSYNNIELVGTSGSIVKKSIVTLNVLNNTFTTLNLTSPSNGTTGVSLSTSLQWSADTNAQSYDVEIAIDSGFNSIVSSTNVTTNSYTVSGLNQSTEYFWRVKPTNICGEGSFSNTFSFTTENCNACVSSGNTTFATATTLVVFGSINNASTKQDEGGIRQGYFDYTAISTVVEKGMTYDLTVNADTDGDYTTHTKVWIDWNQDCDFDDAGEEFDLGIVDNNPDGPTDLSPLSITIPNDALDGNTVMRVSTRYNNDPTSCQTSFDGEVEDYTVEVQSPAASIEDFSFNGFNLYPNPSKGQMTLSFEVINTDKVTTELFDTRGRKIGEQVFKNVSAQFSERLVFDNVSTGIYLLKIENAGKQSVRKIIIK